ncbi:MAG: hypothetical protein ACMG55_04700 [Microcoleus sp.]
MISWTPGVSQQGTYPITARVSDSLGGIATQTLDKIAKIARTGKTPIPQKVFFLWNGHLSRSKI